MVQSKWTIICTIIKKTLICIFIAALLKFNQKNKLVLQLLILETLKETYKKELKLKISD